MGLGRRRTRPSRLAIPAAGPEARLVLSSEQCEGRGHACTQGRHNCGASRYGYTSIWQAAMSGLPSGYQPANFPVPEGAHSFTGAVEADICNDFMGWQMVRVPEAIATALLAAGTRRIYLKLAGHMMRRALMPTGGGGFHLVISQEMRRHTGIDTTAPLYVTIWSDPEPDSIDIPEELYWALDAEPGAQAEFDKLTKGRQRGLCYYLYTAKRDDTRAKRAVDVVQKMMRGELYGQREQSKAK
jgi:hypothetical protein